MEYIDSAKEGAVVLTILGQTHKVNREHIETQSLYYILIFHVNIK